MKTEVLLRLIHFSIFPKNDPKQALRISRFFMAVAAYVLAASLDYFSYLAGFTEWKAIVGLLIIIPIINISLYILFRTGLNLKMTDPSLTGIQMCVAILVVMYGMYFANESRGVLLLAYIIVLIFGIFRLNTRSFLYVSIFTLLTYGINIALRHIYRPQDVNFNIEYLQWGVLALVLVAFSIIGGYISSLRTKISKDSSIIKRLTDNIHDVIFVLDMNLNYTYVSPSVKILRGYEPEEVLKQAPFDAFTPSSLDLAKETIPEVMELGKLENKVTISRTLQLEVKRKDGTAVWTETKFSFIRDKDQRTMGILGVMRDIAERRQMEQQLNYMATHDALTGLPNRLMFNQLLNQAIRSAQRHKKQLAVFFIDLDRFKTINDSLGHEAGDRLLKEIARRFKRSLRAVDVVARLGGDEFVILVEEVNDSSQVEIVAHKILSSAIKPMVLLGEECRVTASIGISIYPKDGQDEQSLTKNADIAMYFAKEEGKNNYQFYSKDTQSQSIERLSIETNMRLALERKEFSLQYQARLDFKTGMITGVEALLRWNNQYLGSVTPTQFIPVAEETGLIVPLGRWVMKTACAQNVAWQRQGLPPVCVAVNLSLRQLMDDKLLEDIKAALDDSGMAPHLLELEITESMVMHNPTRMIAVLTNIKRMGVRLALDDFGTGYSSLAQIKHFPIDTLKVDRSFIRNLPQDSEDKAITEAIIKMGKTLSLTVVAEGVETLEQENFLREHICDEMQGFYFSKPIVPDQFADLLREHVPSPPSEKQ
jgi:diguanylate cyclase (GGDEF)-like protein/PAS domain S-box-containing protein